MRTVQFATGEFFHIYNRGVDKRTIFHDSADHQRFITSVIEFNDRNHCHNASRVSRLRKNRPLSQKTPLVRVLAYCLMHNHYHFLLEQVSDGGVEGFFHRLGTGYTNYYNKRYERTGRLFENTFKAIHVDSDEYLVHLSRYIHLNPLDLFLKDWKRADKLSHEQAALYLHSYRWYSFHDYMTQSNVSGVNVGFEKILCSFSSSKDYEQFVLAWTNNDSLRIHTFDD